MNKFRHSFSFYLHNADKEVSLIAASLYSATKSPVKGLMAYSAKVITIMATSAGLKITTYIHAHVKAGKGPQYL